MDKQREMFEAWWQENRPSCWSADWYAKMQQNMAWNAWQAAIAAQWQPIETAPKDGRAILARTADGMCEIVWNGIRWEQCPCHSTYDGCGEAALSCRPTHWMPLPQEPTK